MDTKAMMHIYAKAGGRGTGDPAIPAQPPREGDVGSDRRALRSFQDFAKTHQLDGSTVSAFPVVDLTRGVPAVQSGSDVSTVRKR